MRPDDPLDVDIAEVLVLDAGLKARHVDERRKDISRTETMTEAEATTRGVKLGPRPPVFTLLGHVDHGGFWEMVAYMDICGLFMNVLMA